MVVSRLLSKYDDDLTLRITIDYGNETFNPTAMAKILLVEQFADGPAIPVTVPVRRIWDWHEGREHFVS